MTGGSSPARCCPCGGVRPSEAFQGCGFSGERLSKCHGRAALLRHSARRPSALSCTHPCKGFSSASPGRSRCHGTCCPGHQPGTPQDSRGQPQGSPVPRQTLLLLSWFGEFLSFCLRVSSKDNYVELGPFAQVTFNSLGGCNELCTAHPFY